MAAISTALLRTSDEPIFQRLRHLLGQRGLDPRKCVLAEWHPEDVIVERGILIAPGEHVVEFELTYGDGDLRQQALTARLTSWHDQTTSWPTMFGAKQVEEGLILLASEQSALPSGYPCPCCGHRTLSEPPGSYEICPVCFWEDDIVQLRWPNMSSGANHVSLIQAQTNYRESCVSEQRLACHVRPAQPNEPVEEGWRPIETSDDFEPLTGLGKSDTPWPEDLEALYWWRPTFWRSPTTPVGHTMLGSPQNEA